jgi:tetrapyrrole methylase family protein/MazG family protein
MLTGSDSGPRARLAPAVGRRAPAECTRRRALRAIFAAVDWRAVHPLDELISTLRHLRGPSGCPWDRRQSFADLCRYLIDEAYELQDTADLHAHDHTIEEMGDALFVALSCALALEDAGVATLDAIAAQAHAKIVRRHPHVFGDRTAETAEEGLKHWQDVKAEERRARGEAPASYLERLPRSLPALRRALAVQRQVAAVGFEWETAAQVHAKLLEESRELREVLTLGDPARLQDELGDLLFSVVNLARFLDADPEAALSGTVEKFTRRFAYVETALRARGRSLEQADLPEMDALWEEAKRHERPASDAAG